MIRQKTHNKKHEAPFPAPHTHPLIIILQVKYNIKGKLEMAKPDKISRERDIFKEFDLNIMLINERIRNHQRSIEKAKKMSGWNGPAGVNGIDYSKESGSGVHISFSEGLRMIQQDKERILELIEERNDLRKSKKRIKKIYESLTGYESRVYYFRVIRKMTQEAAAEEMSVSCRQLQRIERDMREKGLF